jgi:hypothetical protein
MVWTTRLKSGTQCSFVGLAFARRFDGDAGSKTFHGLTYLELILLNIKRLRQLASIKQSERAGRTRLEIMILVSPPEGAAGAVGPALLGLFCLVVFATPPIGASVVRPGPERRLPAPRPRRALPRVVLRMSSREELSLSAIVKDGKWCKTVEVRRGG